MREGAAPSPPVLDAFGAEGEPHLLAGGQGHTYAAGDVILKPARDITEAEWIADVMDGVVEDGFRVTRPVRSANGHWTEDGWTAWQRVDGAHRFRGASWSEALNACKRFHSAISAISRPTFLDRRDDVFFQADKMAFGALDVDSLRPVVVPIVSELRTYVRPMQRSQQLIHGDFAPNVMYAPAQPPAIIDFTPNWRPAAYAVALAFVDAVLWYGADTSLADCLADDSDAVQLVVRAALFRLYEAGLWPGYDGQARLDARGARPIVDWVSDQA